MELRIFTPHLGMSIVPKRNNHHEFGGVIFYYGLKVFNDFDILVGILKCLVFHSYQLVFLSVMLCVMQYLPSYCQIL